MRRIHSFRRPKRWPLGIALTLVLVCGAACQGPAVQTTPESSASITASATSSSQPTSSSPTPASSEPQSYVVDKKYRPLGHFLVAPKSIEGDFRVPSTDGKAQLFIPGRGETTIAGQRLIPGSEVLRESYTSIESKGRPLLAGTVLVREPAKGLNPPQFVTHLVAVDPRTMEVVKRTEVFRSDTQDHYATGLTGSDGPSVAFEVGTHGATVHDSYVVFAFNAVTGEKLWEKPGFAQGQVLGSVVVVSHAKYPACSLYTAVDIQTGSELYQVDSKALSNPCDFTKIASYPDSGVVEWIAERGTYVRFKGESSQSFKATTGKKILLPDVLLGVDPKSSLVVGSNSDTPAQGGFRQFSVTDVETGETLWSLDKNTSAGLSAKVLSFYQGRLYLETADQTPVVDVRTGRVLEENSARYPIGDVDEWTLWSDGTVEKQTSNSAMATSVPSNG